MKLKNKITCLMAVLFVFMFGMAMTAEAKVTYNDGDFCYSLEYGKAYVEGYTRK